MTSGGQTLNIWTFARGDHGFESCYRRQVHYGHPVSDQEAAP